MNSTRDTREIVTKKYIIFEPWLDVDYNPYWRILNRKSRTLLAEVIRYPAWKQWVMANLHPNTIFSHDCLTDIAAFLEKLNGRED